MRWLAGNVPVLVGLRMLPRRREFARRLVEQVWRRRVDAALARRLGPCGVTLYVAIVGASSSAGAAEIVLPLQLGWFADPGSGPYDLQGSTFAIAAYSSSPPIQASRVFIFRNLGGANPATVIGVDILGKVRALQIAPDQQRVLAHSYVPDLGESANRVTMMAVDGAVLWTRDAGRHFSFSTTGEVLGTVGPLTTHWLGPVVERFALDGSCDTRLEFVSSCGPGPRDSEFLVNAVLVGDGSSAVVAGRWAVKRVSFSQPPTVMWTATSGTGTTELTFLRTLDSSHVVAERGDGGFLIIRLADGTVDYTFDPETMDENDGDPVMTRDDRASYAVFSGASEGTAILFNRTYNAYSLNIATGAMTPLAANVNTAPGEVVRDRVISGRMVIVGSRQVRIVSDPRFGASGSSR